MNWNITEQVLNVADELQPQVVDITGGAPELNPFLPRFLIALADRSHKIQLRTNLTVLLDPALNGHTELYQDLQIRLVGSLPCYLEEDVDNVRGKGVFKKSIQILKELNALGYGVSQELELDLVFNPEGAFLPPDQNELEATYKRILSAEFDIHFNRLLTITNMPIGRFKQLLEAEHQAIQYQQLLEDSFNPDTIDGLMCRHQLCVGWDGLIYDCDFNFAMKLPVAVTPHHISQFDPTTHLAREIVTGGHCYGCTAGYGSSCDGALKH
jgi:radical SAM/Cys-rich protein